jgi:LysR family cyn operon transcriptional activator
MKLASEFLHEFHKRYPRIQVTLAVRTPQELAEGLEGGLFDLCGGLELPKTTIFVRKQIFSTRMVGISATSINLPVRITLEELCRTPLVLTSRKCATRLRLDAAFKHAGVKPTVCMEVDEASTINALVKTGTVASILPETLATRVRTVTVHKICDLDIPITGYFLYPRNPGKEADNFMTTIHERIAPRLH